MQNITGALAGGNVMLNNAGITGLSGAATTVSTGKSVDYLVQGKAYTKTALSGAATPTNDASSPLAVAGTAASGAAFRPLVAQQAPAGYTTVYTGSACVFVFGFDAAGNLRVAQGPVANYTDTSANSTVLQFPQLPDWMTPFAYSVIKLTSATAATWTFGAGNWNATGITIDTPVNVGVLPATPPVTA
jgi:hypothetical protein